MNTPHHEVERFHHLLTGHLGNNAPAIDDLADMSLADVLAYADGVGLIGKLDVLAKPARSGIDEDHITRCITAAQSLFASIESEQHPIGIEYYRAVAWLQTPPERSKPYSTAFGQLRSLHTHYKGIGDISIEAIPGSNERRDTSGIPFHFLGGDEEASGKLSYGHQYPAGELLETILKIKKSTQNFGSRRVHALVGVQLEAALA